MNIKQINIDMLIDHPENESIYGVVTPDTDLVESIKERGILQPLRVMLRKGDYESENFFEYIIISGHRRKAASREAGIHWLPCEVVDYDSDEEVLIDLIHSNKHRIKTDKQINDEITRLRSALSQAKKQNSMANLKRGKNDGESPTASNEAVGKTDDQIAEKTGLSKSEIQRRTVVADPDYRSKFFEELLALGANEELVQECRKQWVDVHRQLDIGDKMGGLSVSAAAKAVKQLQKEFLELCPKYTPPKKATSARKKKVAGKGSKTMQIPGELMQIDEDVDEFELAQSVGPDSLIECGILNRGGLRVPAIRREDAVVAFDWDFLLKHSPAKTFVS